MDSVSFLPHLTPEYTKTNSRAIDYSNCGFIAYATGASINLSYLENNKLKQSCPIMIPSSTITCLKFHQEKPILAVGDAKGQIYFVDIHTKNITISARSKSHESVLVVDWKDDVLLALFSHSKFIGVSFKNNSVLWKIILSNQFTSFSIGPHFGNNILFSGRTPIFSIYNYSNNEQSPEPLYEAIKLTTNEDIIDLQWSLHLPGYIFILLSGEILYFHIATRSLITIVPQRLTSSSFEFLLQLPSDHTRFITFLRNGGISIFKTTNDVTFDLIQDSQPYCQQGHIVSATCSPFNDNHIILFHSTLGISLYDLTPNRLISFDISFPSKVTAFDCDGARYASGTNEGYIISGSIYNNEESKRFKVSENEITFISFDTPNSRIFWESQGKLGVIDIPHCKVETYLTKATKILRCFGSRRGALIVQRDLQALGIFIEGKERPLLFDIEVKDVSIDEEVSNSSTGSFCVLLKNQELHFYKYSIKNGVEISTKGLKPRGLNIEPLSFSRNNDIFVTGFTNGLLLFYNTATQKTFRYSTNFSNLRSLTFSNDSTFLFGLCKESTLFKVNVSNGNINICPYSIYKYKLIDNNYLMTMFNDQSIRLIDSNWNSVWNVTQYSPVPSEKQMINNFIRNQNSLYLSPKTRDLWQSLTNDNNVRLQARFSVGKKGLYETINCKLLQLIPNNSSISLVSKLNSLIFIDKFDEASELLLENNSVNDKSYFESSLLAAVMIQIQNGFNEKVQAHLKTSGISLFEAGKFEEGSILFRIGKLDKIAVASLIDYGQDELAIRFMRSCLDVNDLRKFAFKFACKYIEENNELKCLPFLVAANEFQPILQILKNKNLICDAYFVMKYLMRNNLLNEINEQNKKLLPMQLTELNLLCDEIEKCFGELLNELGIKMEEVRI
ncbi:hypothetical protein GPJ56_007112 [Histomonas meleagridis]|uniref:uncharacterized protein n=1 Tax=Histomonas meleagridis TaxID=135588 RepID=UPI003559E1C5|nr:hypothetical protein GPJ56_007112 [Histomonas meleagridis]KAH0796094.1 hypothetical protein GO595_011061 [Histomonas meleagridis]